eukprot:337193_1
MGNIFSTLLNNKIKFLIFLVIGFAFKSWRQQLQKQIVDNDTDIISSERVIKWKNIPPTPRTTLPKSYWILYTLCTMLLLPLHSAICLINAIYKRLIYAINKVFFSPSRSLLAPIKTLNTNYVIITGSAGGIGKDMALLYAEKGFSLILIDINDDVESYANELQNKFKNQLFKALIIDLSSSNAANTIFDTILNKWNICDIVILVNNAGFGLSGEFLNQNMSKLKTMISVNDIICIELAQLFGRYFVLRGKGRICQFASVASYIPGPHHAVYHATKAFIRNWAIAFGYELMATGVGVTIVNPGPVRTLFAKQSNMKESLIFGKMEKHFTYSSISVAKAAVNATLSGKREIVHGPLFHFMQNVFNLYGETYNIMTGKYMQQDRAAKSRSVFEKYKMI